MFIGTTETVFHARAHSWFFVNDSSFVFSITCLKKSSKGISLHRQNRTTNMRLCQHTSNFRSAIAVNPVCCYYHSFFVRKCYLLLLPSTFYNHAEPFRFPLEIWGLGLRKKKGKMRLHASTKPRHVQI